MPVKTAIVIISYNDEGFIADALRSVKDQLDKNWHAIVVDNGSTDDTFGIIQNLTESDSRFEIFQKTNEGPSSGRNFGFGKTNPNTTYIHFLDGDDALHPAYLQKMTAYLDQHPDVGLLACQFEEMDDRGNLIGPGHRSRFVPGLLGFPRDLSYNIYATPFVAFFSATGQGPFGLYRRSVFEKTAGYELGFHHEDTDMYCKMALLAEVHYLPERLYRKRTHKANLSQSDSQKGKYSIFRKKWDLYPAKNLQEERMIDRALKYYYTRHKPLRDLKVALRSIKAFFSIGGKWRLSFAAKCLKSGLEDLLLQRSFRKVMKRRSQHFAKLV